MIKYKLICNECANTFDSWFSSSREYEKLKKQNYINCHICNSLNVEKTLMSPSVLKSQKNYKIDIKKLIKRGGKYMIWADGELSTSIDRIIYFAKNLQVGLFDNLTYDFGDDPALDSF